MPPGMCATAVIALLWREAMSVTAPRVAVIGCGYWGKNLVRNFGALGALAAVVDPRPELAATHAREHGVPALSLDAILAAADVEAVAIAAPAEQHAELTLRALDAGKHVFVEKPLALTVADGERIVARAARAARVVMVGHLLQYHPAFLRLREMVADGTLGRLQYIYSNRLNLGKIRREENVFWSFAPHDLSMILSLAGESPERIEAVGHAYLHPSLVDVTTTHLVFPNGIRAHVFVSWLHPFKEQKLIVVGDGGMAVFDDSESWERKLVLYRHRVLWRDGIPAPSRADAEPVPLEPAEPLKLECQHFLDCVSQDSSPRTDVHEGLAVLRLLEAAQRALRLPPAATRAISTHETACVDDGCTIGPGTCIWHFSHILTGTRIGRNCVIGQGCMIGPNVIVGDGCKIQNNVSVYNGITLEDGVFCGPSCVFTNVLNPRSEVERKSEFRPTIVRRGATIGANASIVCGHELGKYCMIGAGAVVTGDVPAFALVVGNPARRLGWVSHAGERLGPDLICPRTGRRYREVGSDRLEEML